VKQALDYETERQARDLDAGRPIRQVTVGWDEAQGRTVEQRPKETSDDYRYFPEPDLPPLHITRAWVDELRAQLPELPDARRDRFLAEYGLTRDDAALLAADHEVAGYFEAAVAAGRKLGVSPRITGHWVTGDLFRLLRARDLEIEQAPVGPEALAELIGLVESSTITANSSKQVLEEMVASGQTAAAIVEARGLAQISDRDALAGIVQEIMDANPEQVARYREGKATLLQWFVGQVMRATRGQANPQVVMDVLRENLG
jgi:aspartyl-tRNA(Asn)/glutamyl-tRNA(Gln) amidotransferase subunit B